MTVVTDSEVTGTIGRYAAQIDELIALAKDDPAVQDILQFGTPQAKLDLLQERVDLSFEDLVEMQRDLEEVIFAGSLPFWWW